MSLHVFGAIVTAPGVAANNRGETEGHITTLQKLLWQGEVHTTVSAEAIRWAIRYYWQMKNPLEINRRWEDDRSDHKLQDTDFLAWDTIAPSGVAYWDDDLLGFMDTTAGSEEAEVQSEIPNRLKELEEEVGKKPDDRKAEEKLKRFKEAVEKLSEVRKQLHETDPDGASAKKLEKQIRKLRNSAGLKGRAITRRGVLEIARAVSTIPFAGDITFNAKSGEKGRTSLYRTEVHATRYQYAFAMTPERLRVKERAIDAVEAIVNLGEVAGNHSRFLFDFSPESIVLRITEDPAPRLLYCFRENEDSTVAAPELVRRVDVGDMAPSDLFIGGLLAEAPDVSALKEKGVHLYKGVKDAVTDFQAELRRKLELPSEPQP